MLREVWLNIGVEKIDMHEGIVRGLMLRLLRSHGRVRVS